MNPVTRPRTPLPYPPFLLGIVASSSIVWMLVRLVFVAVGGSLALTTKASAVVVLLTVGLVWHDRRRFHKLRFHAGLGMPPALGVAIAFVAVVALEIAASVLLRAQPL
jgi:hypothetical protein